MCKSKTTSLDKVRCNVYLHKKNHLYAQQNTDIVMIYRIAEEIKRHGNIKVNQKKSNSEKERGSKSTKIGLDIIYFADIDNLRI